MEFSHPKEGLAQKRKEKNELQTLSVEGEGGGFSQSETCLSTLQHFEQLYIEQLCINNASTETCALPDSCKQL